MASSAGQRQLLKFGVFDVDLAACEIRKASFNLYALEDGFKRTVTIKDWARLTGFDFAADSKSLWVGAFANTGKWALLSIDLHGHARTMLEDPETIQWAVPAPDGKHLAIPKARVTSNV